MKIKMIMGIFILTLSLNACASAPTANLSVQVVDEAQKPMEGVSVKGGFTTLMLDYVPGPDTQGITDSEGRVELSGPGYFNVRVVANKQGYYQSEKKVPVNHKKDQDVSILLRSKRNPISMYAKKALISARETRKNGTQFGYDLLVGDFVYPHGKGKINDLLITHSYQKKDTWNYSLEITISFSNPLDGVIPFYIDKKLKESVFTSNHIAPVDGYKNEWVITASRNGKGSETKGNRDNNRNYYFRVRTKADKKGNIETASYGKIYGEFPFISYYYNPTPNDRNIEFNIRKNLFKSLKYDEEVSAP